MSDVVEDLSTKTDEEKAALWEKYVRGEVGALLDMFLPIAAGGNVGVRYTPHVIERLESGDQVDKTKADAVSIFLVFEFDKPLDLTSSRVDEENPTVE